MLDFVTLDVFTSTPFEGNPLAVVFDAGELTTSEMQRIAFEFGYSETTFVLGKPGDGVLGKPGPDDSGQDGPVAMRIFTPTIEMPFAGHPTIGTAVALAIRHGLTALTFSVPAGLVPVVMSGMDGRGGEARFDAPQAPFQGETVEAGLVAGYLGLEDEQVLTQAGLPSAASCGARFLVAELRDLAGLQAARLGQDIPEVLLPHGLDHGVYLFTRDCGDQAGDVDLRCRMFSPLDGFGEDPATGSAAAALGGVLALNEGVGAEERGWRLLQGHEMGRPSRIDVYARKSDANEIVISVAGRAVLMMEGRIRP